MEWGLVGSRKEMKQSNIVAMKLVKGLEHKGRIVAMEISPNHKASKEFGVSWYL